VGCIDDFKAQAGQAVVDSINGVLSEATDPVGLANRLGVSAAQVNAAKDVVNNGMASLKSLINIPAGALEVPEVAGALQDKIKAVAMQTDLGTIVSALDTFEMDFPACATDPVLLSLRGMEARLGETVQAVANIDTFALTAAKTATQNKVDEIQSQISDAANIKSEFGL
jgi:hypothetical protein